MNPLTVVKNYRLPRPPTPPTTQRELQHRTTVMSRRTLHLGRSGFTENTFLIRKSTRHEVGWCVRCSLKYHRNFVWDIITEVVQPTK